MRYLLLVLLPVMAFAQLTATPTPVSDIVMPSFEEIQAWLKAIGGLKGAGVLGIVLFAVQGLVLFFRSSLAQFAGLWQLLIINGLTLVLCVVGLKLTGASWGAALFASQNWAFFQLFLNQFMKQLKKKPEDEKTIAATLPPVA